MRIDRSHTPWILMVVIATAGATVLFLANFYPEQLPFAVRLPTVFGDIPPKRHTFGGTPLGVVFGSLAFLIFLFAAALGIRKKRRLWRIGSAQFWLKAHIWLTVLTIPLVLYHCGFHLGGPHTTWLMFLYGVVMGSGIFGLVLQQFMPKLMKERLPREVVFEQIPHIRGLILDAAKAFREELAEASKTAAPPAAPLPEAGGVPESRPTSAATASKEDPSLQILTEFMDSECLPYLQRRRGTGMRLGDQRMAQNIFRLLRLNVTEKWSPRVEELFRWCEDRRLMDLQVRLHHWLHGWLLVHVPTSFVLLIYTAWHAWVAVRYLVVVP
jgi:hypothetical protein